MAIDVEIYDMRLLKKDSERTDMVFTARFGSKEYRRLRIYQGGDNQLHMDVRNYSPRSDLKRVIRDAAILEYQSMISRTNPVISQWI